MNKVLLALALLASLCYVQIQSECLECRNLLRELTLERKNNNDQAKIISSLTKDLVSYSEKLRKFNGMY